MKPFAARASVVVLVVLVALAAIIYGLAEIQTRHLLNALSSSDPVTLERTLYASSTKPLPFGRGRKAIALKICELLDNESPRVKRAAILACDGSLARFSLLEDPAVRARIQHAMEEYNNGPNHSDQLSLEESNGRPCISVSARVR